MKFKAIIYDFDCFYSNGIITMELDSSFHHLALFEVFQLVLDLYVLILRWTFLHKADHQGRLVNNPTQGCLFNCFCYWSDYFVCEFALFYYQRDLFDAVYFPSLDLYLNWMWTPSPISYYYHWY